MKTSLALAARLGPATLQLLAVGAALASGACADDGRPGPIAAGPRVAIEVAPLSLPGVVDACYGLEVRNEAGETVWRENSLCADGYGDGASDISYVGPCDATDGADPDSVATATVILTIEGLYGPDGTLGASDGTPDRLRDGTDWRNPCAPPYATDGCELRTECRENADMPIRFDLTVLRSANQGFFDIAVTFDDIFCSAKVDCARPDGTPLRLVFDPVSGERLASVVWALACTDGDPTGTGADSETHLYMSDVLVVCDGVSHPIVPSDGPGNLYPTGIAPPPTRPFAQAMVFEGSEVATSGAATTDTLYWNVALGLQPAFLVAATGSSSCTLEVRATAARGALALGATPSESHYPYIDVSVPLTRGSTIVCSQHGLDQVGIHAGVATAYTPTPEGDTSVSFAHEAVRAGEGVITRRVVLPPPPAPDRGVLLSLQYAQSGDGGFYNFYSLAVPLPTSDEDCARNAGYATVLQVVVNGGTTDESVATDLGFNGYLWNGGNNCRVYSTSASLPSQVNPSAQIILGAGGGAVQCLPSEFREGSSCFACTSRFDYALTCNAVEASSCTSGTYLQTGRCHLCGERFPNAATCFSNGVETCLPGFNLVAGNCYADVPFPDDGVELGIQYVQPGPAGFYNYLTHSLAMDGASCRDAHTPVPAVQVVGGPRELIDTSRGVDGFESNGEGNCRVYVLGGTTSASAIRFVP